MTSWRNQSFDVYTLDQLELEKPELFDKYDEMARSTIWCEYEDDYRLVSYVVFKGIPTTIGPINPLMETQWDQRSGFNQSYPIRYLNGVPYLPPAGCGPVALGQIMYYHKYPANINWAGMDKDNGTKVTSDFLLDIATRANADIQALETFNDETGIMNTLMSYNYQYSFATKDFQNKAMQSLRNRRPVYVANCMYKSDGKKTGHAWVLDDAFSSTIGETVEFWTCMNKRKFEMHYWDTQYYNPGTSYHINWGWGGDNNGYYTNWENFTPSQYHNGSIQYLFYDIHP